MKIAFNTRTSKFTLLLSILFQVVLHDVQSDNPPPGPLQVKQEELHKTQLIFKVPLS